MKLRLARSSPPVALVVALTAAVVIARREGTPRSPPIPAPAPPTAASARAVPAPLASVAERLAAHPDRLRAELPRLDRAYPGFRKACWRSLPSPYARSSPLPRRALSIVALPSSRELGQKAEQASGWREDERTWNMSQASFELRESFVAPPPGTLRYRVRLPEGGRLEVGTAAVALPASSVTFEVAVRAASGERAVVDQSRVSAGEPTAWHERVVDLSRFSGEEVELELVTTTRYTGDDPPTALWGTPTIVGRGPAPVPYSVLWIVVDALRPDVLAALHTPELDAARAAAALPPKEAWLPAMPTVAPNLDALAARGVSFADATSAATWTRPGTIALLAGARSTELGLDATPWVLPESTIQQFYSRRPPLVPLVLGGLGVRVEGFVNNFFLAGYARVGVDAGFPRLVDHRHETLDTRRIVRDAVAFLEARKDERTFAFVNLNSPHNPYDPPDRCLARVPPPPLGPRDPTVRKYLAEISKDDEAVGELLAALDRTGARERTLVVVTADHGETLSEDHDWLVHGLGKGQGSTRFRHANAMFDETTRVPLVLSLPGVLPEGRVVRAPVSTIDLAPTVLSVLGVPAPPRMTGVDLTPLARGADGPRDRPIVTEGRAARSVRVGRYRYVERDPAAREVSGPTLGHHVWREELYDLEADPGERRNVVADLPDVASRLREELGAALATSTTFDTKDSEALAATRHVRRPAGEPLRVRLRFVGAGRARRFALRGSLPAPEPGAPEPTVRGTVVAAEPEALRVDGRAFDLSLTSLPDAQVGVDLELSPSTAPLTWEVSLDDAPIPPELMFAGRYGLSLPALAAGLVGADARAFAVGEAVPRIDPRGDLGVFVVVAPGDVSVVDGARDEALQEMRGLLEAWGYAKTAK
ncbi:MAG: sulfatase [Polyangiaceae bacterium]|nr:sulfatase [Polyangiaceae bacterium]